MANNPRFCGDCGTELVSVYDRFCTTCGREARHTAGGFLPTGTRDNSVATTCLGSYQSPKTRSAWTLIFFAGLTAVVLASFISTFAEIGLLQRVADGEFVPERELLANDDRQSVIGGITLLVYIGLIIAFCIWVHRAAKNLEALNVVGQRFSPRWAVGWWFVPFMNLFRPYQVVKEIWKGSDPRVTAEDSSAWRNAPTSVLLGWWWGIWIVSNLINNGVGRVFRSSDTSLDELITADYFSMIGDGLTIVAAVLAFILVRGITSNQNAKYLNLRNITETPSASEGRV
mgnify:CR=1 FL=1